MLAAHGLIETASHFGVFAGAEVAGVAGTFLSVPVLAMARILYLHIRKARLGSQYSPAGTVRL